MGECYRDTGRAAYNHKASPIAAMANNVSPFLGVVNDAITELVGSILARPFFNPDWLEGEYGRPENRIRIWYHHSEVEGEYGIMSMGRSVDNPSGAVPIEQRAIYIPGFMEIMRSDFIIKQAIEGFDVFGSGMEMLFDNDPAIATLLTTELELLGTVLKLFFVVYSPAKGRIFYGQTPISNHAGVFQRQRKTSDRKRIFTGRSSAKYQRLSCILRDALCASHGHSMA